MLKSSLHSVIALRAWSRPKNRLSFKSSSRIRPLKLSRYPIHRLSRRDVVPLGAVNLRPGKDDVRDELGAVAGTDQCPVCRDGRSVSSNHVPTDYRDRGVRDHSQQSRVTSSTNVQHPKTPSASEPVVHEIQRPRASALPRRGSALTCPPLGAHGACEQPKMRTSTLR